LRKKFNITEEELVELLKDGNEKGLEVLYKNYSKALYNVIFQIVKSDEMAEEALHDGFLKIWKNAQSYDRSKGTIFTWMLNICRNAAIDKTRSKEFKNETKNQNLENSVNLEKDLPTGFSPETIGVTKLVSRLKPELRDVIELIFMQGYTQVEAAAALKLPLGTIKTRSRSAILELRKLFAVIIFLLIALLKILA
jgi:RNA polymerase sigma-70 factor (ECF subfamily)